MAQESAHIERVLLVAPHLEARGTSECIFNLARELRRLEVSVAVFCAPGPVLEMFRREQVPVRTFEHMEGMRLRFAEKRTLLRAVEEFSPQLVHGHTFRVASALTLLRRRIAAPQVLTLHWLPKADRSARRSLRGLDGIIASTESVREGLVNRCGVEKQKVKVIANGIDLERLARRQMPPIFRSAVPAVGSLGPIEEQRGHELFVKAAALIVKTGAPVQFVVAGQGDELPGIRKLVRNLGLQHDVTIAPDFATYVDVLDALDVVVQSSQVDVSGLSILEAMGCGRPVIAFNTGTACEIIEDGRTGKLVPKGDVDALAAAIVHLIQNKDEARQMASNAQEAVRERFDIRNTAAETLDYYRDVLAASETSSA
jgi:glycosyltransferase involved in cell wall biosynthesis